MSTANSFSQPGSQGNANYLRTRLVEFRQSGEKAKASQFKVTFEGYPLLSLLATNVQIPPYKRVDIESYGPMGLRSNEPGVLENGGVATAMIAETIKGEVLKELRRMVRDKITIPSVDIGLTPESAGGAVVGGTRLLDAWIGCESADLANDSVTEILKLPININFIWCDDI